MNVRPIDDRDPADRPTHHERTTGGPGFPGPER